MLEALKKPYLLQKQFNLDMAINDKN